MKFTSVIPCMGFLASALMLTLRLPLTSVDTTGVAWTVLFFVLNPPFLAVKVLAPHEVHDLEHSIWPSVEYPVALLASLTWWVFIAWVLKRRAKPSQSAL